MDKSGPAKVSEIFSGIDRMTSSLFGLLPIRFT
jgi:hypothetical protein